ncbi:MAG: helix-hairpin-helix domain-containing protein, partial [Syntrophomonadaceae bacterium]|nr:helix-hairpin-helix domain-containing protein [Syntrophomonadaceae bacterium]
MEYLSGVVERITYENEESGFRVIKIKSRGFSDLVTVVGNLAAVNVGSIVRLRGEWRADRRYGRQFVALDCQETMPATAAGIEKYLGSGLIKGIGPVFARRIVSRFKEETLQVLEERAEYLAEVEGIGPKRLEMIKRAWQEQKEIRNVMLFLQGHGVSPAYAVKIFKAYGNQSIDIVRANPYRLADDIWGIGFKTADKIARQLGFDQNSFERCRSGIVYVLNELSNEGHCYADRGQLAEEAERMLEIGRPLVEATLERMIEEKTVIADEGDSIYLPSFYYSEVGTARKIREILAAESRYRGAEVGRVVEAVERDEGIRYDGLQQEAIRTAVASKLMVLTGGPGTGKTTTTQAIIKVFERLGAVVL